MSAIGSSTSLRESSSPGVLGDEAGSVAQLLRDVRGRSAREMTELIAERIVAGELPAGTRLPTIKEFATASGASVSSIATGWARLAERGLIRTRRRGGTIVVGVGAWPQAEAPRQFRGWASIDLSTAHPAAEHLPDLRRAFELSLAEPRTHSLRRENITEQLRAAVEAEWPYAAQEWTTVSGAAEAILIACEAATPPGGVIAVQEPTTPGTVANLRSLGYTLLGVVSDEEGPVPASLAEALAAGARTFLYQPEGTLSVYSCTTTERLRELAEILRRQAPDTWVIEEDVFAGLTPGVAHTLAHELPDRVVRLASYCRAFGIDLRTTVIGGSRLLVERARLLRSHGILTQSRILQNALAHMLRDPAARAFVASATTEYATSARVLTAALAEQGIEAHSPPGGLLVWFPAADEAQAHAELAVSGVNLVASVRSFVTPPEQHLLRVATPQLPESRHIDELAVLLAAAARETVVDA